MGAVSAGVQLVERLALVAVAVSFVDVGGHGRVYVVAGFLALHVTRGILRSSLTGRAHARLHDRAFRGLLGGDLLRASVFDDVDTEAVLLGGLDRGARLVGELVPQIAGDIAASLVLLALLFTRESPALLGVVLGALVAAGLTLLVARRWTLAALEASWASYRPVLDGLVAAALARLEIVANGGARTFLVARREEVRAWVALVVRSDRVAGLAGRAPLVLGGALLLAAFLADRGAGDGSLTTSAMTQAVLFGSMLPAFAGVAWGAHEIAKATAVFAPMMSILAEGDASRQSPGARADVPALPAEIRFDGVTFSYPGAREPALLDVTFSWKPGAVLVLRGKNGSGKSTLVKLLLGLGGPHKGALTVAGAPLAALDREAWHAEVAYLPQRPYLVDRSTVGRAMSALDDRPLDADKARAALARAGLLETLERKLPETPLDVLVGSLSAGERQRLALARILAGDKRLVLLDEPDANLDAEGIKLVAGLVRELRSSSMVIVCAHTPDLVAAGDLVVHLERGRIVEVVAS